MSATMTYQTLEQLKHDRINLHRIVKNLEPVVLSDSFRSPAAEDRRARWASTAATQTTIKYAQDLLEKVKGANSSGSYDDVKRSLDRMQSMVQDVREKLELAPPRPKSLLSSMKMPRPVPPPVSIEPPPAVVPEAELLPGEGDPAPFSPLILSPAIERTGLPRQSTSPPPEASQTKPSEFNKQSTPAGPAFLSTSLATQEELADQLALMGRQLRLNAQHFSNSLAKEKGVIEDASEKLEGNLGTMNKERVRLRDHSGKSGSTTWMVLGAIIFVIVAWIMMFFIIRLT